MPVNIENFPGFVSQIGQHQLIGLRERGDPFKDGRRIVHGKLMAEGFGLPVGLLPYNGVEVGIE